MRRFSRVAGVVVSAALMSASPAPQSPGATTVEPITAHVFVTDQNGSTPIRHLRREDFEILSDGISVPVLSFSADPEPLTAVVLFDVSASIGLKAAADKATLDAFDTGFLPNLAVEDRVRIGSFAGSFVLSPSFSSAHSALMVAAQQAFAVPRETRYGPSPVWDAVDAAVSALETEPGRRAVVVLTDGKASGDVHGSEDVLRHAAVADVALWIVGQRLAFGALSVLKPAADSTGGVYLEYVQKLGPGLPFSRVLDGLHSTYQLAFAPPVSDGALHTLEVRLTVPGLKAYRRRYLAPRR